jgi:hypothetical protein
VSDYEIDICLSFAGEQRPYVEQVARLLRERGVSVFYDGYEEAGLWGKDLYEHLDSVYRTKSRFCILFASGEYAEKVWTTHERKSAQARAIQGSEEYILPARFDDTEIPGIRPTVGYVDLRTRSPGQLVDLVVRKLASVSGRHLEEEVSGPAYSTVPTTVEERATLISLRPSGWEHFLFGGIMLEGKGRLQSKMRDHDLGYAMPTRRFSNDRDAVAYVSDQLSGATILSRNVMKLLDGRAQVRAFGRLGEPGDVENITHLGKRLVDSCDAYLDWAADIRGTVTSQKLERVFELSARMADGPIRSIEEFIDEYVCKMRVLPERLAAGGPVKFNLTLTLDVDDVVHRELQEEMALLTRAVTGGN